MIDASTPHPLTPKLVATQGSGRDQAPASPEQSSFAAALSEAALDLSTDKAATSEKPSGLLLDPRTWKRRGPVSDETPHESPQPVALAAALHAEHVAWRFPGQPAGTTPAGGVSSIDPGTRANEPRNPTAIAASGAGATPSAAEKVTDAAAAADVVDALVKQSAADAPSSLGRIPLGDPAGGSSLTNGGKPPEAAHTTDASPPPSITTLLERLVARASSPNEAPLPADAKSPPTAANAASAGPLPADAKSSPNAANGARVSPPLADAKLPPTAVDAAAKQPGAAGIATQPERSLRGPRPPQDGASSASSMVQAPTAPPRAIVSGDSAVSAPVSEVSAPAANLAAAAPAAGSSPQTGAGHEVRAYVTSSEWGTAVADHVLRMAVRGSHEVQLNLNPTELGPLKITLSMNAGHAQIAFQSEHAAVRQAIEAAMPQLQKAMQDSGITLGQTSVGSSGSQAMGGQNHPEQQQDRPQQRPQPLEPAAANVHDHSRAGAERVPTKGLGLDIFA